MQTDPQLYIINGEKWKICIHISLKLSKLSHRAFSLYLEVLKCNEDFLKNKNLYNLHNEITGFLKDNNVVAAIKLIW